MPDVNQLVGRQGEALAADHLQRMGYKILEQKDVVVDEVLGRDEALAILREALELYRDLRRGENPPGV